MTKEPEVSLIQSLYSPNFVRQLCVIGASALSHCETSCTCVFVVSSVNFNSNNRHNTIFLVFREFGILCILSFIPNPSTVLNSSPM